MSSATETPFARLLRVVAKVEPLEARAVFASFAFCFFVFASYFILRPLRDTMGTVYGVQPSAGAIHRYFPRQLHRRAGLCRPGLAHSAGDLLAVGLWLHRPDDARLLFRVHRACQ